MANETQGRRISFYPNPLYNKLLTAYSFVNCVYKSEAVEEINKKFFDSMPQSERQALLKAYEEMTPEQRKTGKKPKRI